MSAKTQVVISTDLNGELNSVCVWDLVTANTAITYKTAGVVQRHCLDLIKDQLIISAVKESPIINVWSFERKDQLHQKIICPNKVTALKMTNDGKYCLVAINTSLYIWQISSGNLLAVLEKHYQKITCIGMTSDSSHFVTAGDDGLAMVWSLSRCIAFSDFDLNDSNSTAKDPIHKWSDHTNAITDVYIGFGGIDAKCMTSSIDQTCRIYELFSGKQIVTIVFSTPLWSVVMDAKQSSLFVGGQDSNIYETKLFKRPSNDKQQQIKPQFIGHESSVTCLSISIDGLALISGSDDNTIKIWHIITKQCMRTVTNRGPVSNILVVPYPSGLYLNERSNVVIKAFKRTPLNNLWNTDPEDELTIEVINSKSLKTSLSFMEGIEEELNDWTQLNKLDFNSSNVNESEDLKKELNDLKQINSKLYNYSVDAIFKSIP